MATAAATEPIRMSRCPIWAISWASTPFTFSGTVYPGTYRITVTGGLSSLPGASYVAYESLSLGL